MSISNFFRNIRNTQVENSFGSAVQSGNKDQNVSITDVIAEGPIRGLVGGTAGIYLDNIPLENATYRQFDPGEFANISFNGSSSAGTVTGATIPDDIELDPDTPTSVEIQGIYSGSATLGTITSASSITVIPLTAQSGTTFTADWNSSVEQRVSISKTGAELVGSFVQTSGTTGTLYITAFDPLASSYASVAGFASGDSVKIQVNGVRAVEAFSASSITILGDLPSSGDYQFSLFETPTNSNPVLGSGQFSGLDTPIVQFRSGTPFQAPIETVGGVGGAVNGAGVAPSSPNLKIIESGAVPGFSPIDIGGLPDDNLTDTAPTPLTLTSTNFGLGQASKRKEADEINFAINYQALQTVNQEGGGDEDAYAHYVVRIRFKNTSSDSFGAWENAFPNYGGKIIHKGNTSAARQFDHYIGLNQYRPFHDFEVQIIRLTRHIGLPVGADGGNGGRSDKDKWLLRAEARVGQVGHTIKDIFNYPYTALASIGFSSKTFQRVPKRSYLIEGKMVQVPTSYTPREYSSDGVAKYEDFWDGGFKEELQYTDNPAWVFYDMMTNKRYGAGQYIQEENIDKYALYKIAKYCDELVDDGNGGTEPRFRANLFLQKETEVYKVAKDMATMFLGILYWMDSKLVVVNDAPQDPVQTFTKGNVLEAGFSYESTGARTKVNQVVVTYNDPDSNYEPVAVVVEDRNAISRVGRIVSTEAVAFGATSEAQALRYGRWKLWTSQNQTEVISFVTGLQGAYVRPGDIINVQDADRYGVVYSGRIKSGSAAGITLDRSITLNPGSQYYLNTFVNDVAAFLNSGSSVTIGSNTYEPGDKVTSAYVYDTVNNNGTFDLVTLDSESAAANAFLDSAGTIPLSLTWKPYSYVLTKELDEASSNSTYLVPTTVFTGTEIPTRETIWSLSEEADGVNVLGSTKQYKVLGVKSEEKNTFAISAVEHYNSKFQAVETDYYLGSVPDSVFPTKVDETLPTAAKPKNLRVFLKSTNVSGGDEFALLWDINEDQLDKIAEFEIAHNLSNYPTPIRVSEQFFNVVEVPNGEAVFRVRSVGAQEEKSPWATFRYLVDDPYDTSIPRVHRIPAGVFSNVDARYSKSVGKFLFDSTSTSYVASIGDPGTRTLLNSPPELVLSGSSISAANTAEYYVFFDKSESSISLKHWDTTSLNSINYWRDANTGDLNASQSSDWTSIGTVTVSANSNVLQGTSLCSSLNLRDVINLSGSNDPASVANSVSYAATVISIQDNTTAIIDRTFENNLSSITAYRATYRPDYAGDAIVSRITYSVSQSAIIAENSITVGLPLDGQVITVGENGAITLVEGAVGTSFIADQAITESKLSIALAGRLSSTSAAAAAASAAAATAINSASVAEAAASAAQATASAALASASSATATASAALASIGSVSSIAATASAAAATASAAAATASAAATAAEGSASVALAAANTASALAASAIGLAESAASDASSALASVVSVSSLASTAQSTADAALAAASAAQAAADSAAVTASTAQAAASSASSVAATASSIAAQAAADVDSLSSQFTTLSSDTAAAASAAAVSAASASSFALSAQAAATSSQSSALFAQAQSQSAANFAGAAQTFAASASAFSSSAQRSANASASSAQVATVASDSANAAATAANLSATSASAFSASAQRSANASASSAQIATTASGSANAAATAANTSASNASASESAAGTSATAAQSSAQVAQASESAAGVSATAANLSATSASAFSSSAQRSSDASASSAQVAQASESAAGASATAANTSANSASASQSAAAVSAGASASSAQVATTAAASANTAATAANLSATSASAFSASAQRSAGASASSAQIASVASTSANNAATAANNSASQASASESAAGVSANASASSAQIAQASESAAAVSATAANLSATSASAFSASAQRSANASASSAQIASTASGSANNAATAANLSASNASASESAAGTSATAAQSSAQVAQASESAAGVSATAANLSATSASAFSSSAQRSSQASASSAQVATTASGSANAAATAANLSASNASASQSAALVSANASASSAQIATTASGSANNAATAANLSASQASASQSAAGTSATAAQSSAQVAQASESAAGVSATAANLSATSASAFSSSAQRSSQASASSAQIASTASDSANAAATAANLSATSASAFSASAQRSAQASASSAQIATTASGSANAAATAANLSASQASASQSAALVSANASASSAQVATTASGSANAAATAANISASNASASESAAGTSATASQSSAQVAQASESAAGVSATAANNSATSASAFSASAQRSSQASASSAQVATTASGSANAAATAANISASNASASQSAALVSANASASSAQVATTASGSANAAATAANLSASNASASESAAGTSATAAQSSAQVATTQRQSASSFATAANLSATSASAFSSSAQRSANASASSAQVATTASGSANAAATAANISASNASASESAAGTSATASQSSAQVATAQRQSASSFATAANNSATSASAFSASAQRSANASASSAQIATTASDSANEAATAANLSASNASASESAAGTSATAAQSSAQIAEAARDSITLTNILPDGDFELQGAEGQFSDGWDPETGRWELSTAQAHKGSYAAKLTSTGASDTFAGIYNLDFPINSGEAFTLGMWVYNNTGGNVTFALSQQGGWASFATTSNGAWTFYHASGSATSNYSAGAVSIDKRSQAVTSNSNLWIDEVVLVRGTHDLDVLTVDGEAATRAFAANLFATSASAFSSSAQRSSQASASSAQIASTASGSANQAAIAANLSATNASASESAAGTSATASQSSAQVATAQRQSASSFATAANLSATSASAFSSSAQRSSQASASSAQIASTASQSASSFAAAANISATAASASETAAATSATASQSSAQVATTQRQSASSFATAANTSATSASAFSASAQRSAQASASSAQVATTQSRSASSFATAANLSASNAAASESAAGVSANASESSATVASTASGSAKTAAAAAVISEANAAASESAAAVSASAAQVNRLAASAASISAQASASSAFVSQQSASSFASQAQSSAAAAVQDVRLLQARVTGRGLGHYAQGAWFVTQSSVRVVTTESSLTVFEDTNIIIESTDSYSTYNLTLSNPPSLISATGPIYVLDDDDKMAVPTALSGTVFADYYTRNTPRTYTFFSERANATVSVYSRTSLGTFDIDSLTAENTFTVPRGGSTTFSTADLNTNSGLTTAALAFVSDAPIIGSATGTTDVDGVVMVPLSNGELVRNSRTNNQITVRLNGDTGTITTVTNGSAKVDISPNENVYAFANGIGDGSGTDSEVAIARRYLSDFYMFHRDGLSNYRIVSLEPNDIVVTKADGTVVAREQLNNATEDQPVFSASGIEAGSTNFSTGGPYAFSGTAPFFLVAQSADSPTAQEITMLGGLQGQLGISYQTATARQINIVQAATDAASAAIVTETNARTTLSTALASDIQTLTTSVSSNTTSIQTSQSSINGLEAQYTVKIDNNDHVSGFGLASTSVSGSVTSAFIVRADKFAVVNPASGIGLVDDIVSACADAVPFVIENGITKVKKVQADSITAQELEVSSTTSGANNSMYFSASSSIRIYDNSGTLRVHIGNLNDTS